MGRQKMTFMNLILMFLLLGIQFNNFKLVECSATLTNTISKGQILENFSKWGPAFRMEFDITVQKSAEICTVKATSDVAMFGNWMKKSYEEAKAICGLSGKELAYFEDDEASFNTFFEAFYNKNNYYFWVGAKIATVDGSRKYQWEKTLEAFGDAKSNDYEIQKYGKTFKFSKNKDGEDCVVAKKENDNKIKFNDKKCNDDKYFMCKTISDGKPCVLPWKNGNETNWYYGCAEPAANRPWNDEKWCPTEVDGNKRFNPWTNYNWNKNWGYCEDICLDTSKWTTVTTWVNVFAFKNNDGPRLYIHKDKLLHFCSSVSGNSNLCFNFEYQNNQKYHIVIKQYPKQISQTCTSYIYEIEIDGKQEYSIENTKPQEFENVKLYASHPSHIPFTSEIGLLQNLQIEQGNISQCQAGNLGSQCQLKRDVTYQENAFGCIKGQMKQIFTEDGSSELTFSEIGKYGSGI